VPQGADGPHPVQEVKVKWSKRLPTFKGHQNPSKEKEEMVGRFSVWRMIKVYGMIILVMAMDIDGCVLNKAVNREKSRPINRTVTIDLSSRKAAPFWPENSLPCRWANGKKLKSRIVGFWLHRQNWSKELTQ